MQMLCSIALLIDRLKEYQLLHHAANWLTAAAAVCE
jgi:hypothetical protein